MTAVTDLIGSLRSIDAPEKLFPLAATASALMATAKKPGALLVAYVATLAIAHDLDGEPLSEADWAAVKKVLARLAGYLESPEAATLESLAFEWRDWKRPPALH